MGAVRRAIGAVRHINRSLNKGTVKNHDSSFLNFYAENTILHPLEIPIVRTIIIIIVVTVFPGIIVSIR